jgi:release factor glutamine methyltransferase
MAAGQPPTSIDAALARAAAALRGCDNPALEAQLLLAHVLGRSRGELLATGEDALPAAARARFEGALERRVAGVPLAYITGRREFWSLDLAVTPAVLVPRPETELVVERALALLGSRPASLADLGTGSGAIALALAFERPRWRITATDSSTAALAVARENARALSISNVRFLEGAWYAPLEGERFDLIASNPPYVAEGDPVLHDSGLRHEPLTALASGTTGLEDLTAIVAGAAAHLAPGGWLVLEHAPAQAGTVAEMLVAHGFGHVRCQADLAGLARVTEAQRAAAAGAPA